MDLHSLVRRVVDAANTGHFCCCCSCVATVERREEVKEEVVVVGDKLDVN